MALIIKKGKSMPYFHISVRAGRFNFPRYFSEVSFPIRVPSRLEIPLFF